MERELEQLEGTVEDIIYQNEENGYTVFEVSGGGVVTVVCGVVGELHAGESVVCRGRYENHATYGRQFHAQECETDMPKDLEAVYAFLASRSLPYIGARTADKIIDKFGAAALEVIANDPAQLTLIPGISADKADRIQQEFKRMFGMRELIAYLAQFEISPRRAMEVFRTFGPGAMTAIQQNPYLLCGEPLQLDFRHADSIAQYYQMAGDCAQRLEAALLRTLRHNAGNGHTCLPRAQLLATASNFIHQPPEKLDEALARCLGAETLAEKTFDGTEYIYLPDLLAAEQDIADRLALLTKRGKQTAHGLDKNIQILELAQGFAYAPLQREAIRKAMTENCLVLTGGPGTGKTTTVNAILQLLEDQAERVALCAPTGRAAKRLSELTGISADKADRIQQEFKRMFGMRELIAYLAQFEISPRRAMEVFRTFGPGAMTAIQQNPYLLCGEPLQLDFRHADSIAQYYQMAGDCAQRLEAALLRTLRHNAGNGHTCLPRAQLLATASNFIHQPPEKLDEALARCLGAETLAEKTFDGTEYIYLPDLLAAEQDIADRLALLTKRGKQTAHGLDKNIQILELAQGFAYAPLQREAIRKAMTENCLVLTGGPGTGKTTTVNAILQLLEDQAERVALCAPTGRAAKRLSELTGRKASTIHRLLEVDYTGGVVSFIHNDKNLLKCDVVILDEMSMVDVRLFQALIAALRYSCRIIMVGDADQLPSVGPGNILGEVIRSGLVPTVCLNEIFRQAAQSLIVENAHHIISGEPLKKGGKTDDFFFLESDGDAAQKLVCDLVTTRLPRSYQFDPVKDIQVLCPTKLGPTGTQALNVELQALLNPPQKGRPELQSAARVFRVGDKVMQVRNNYEITWQRIGGEQGVGAYNGDIGIVESIDPRSRSMVVRMDDRRLVYPAENLNELEIAYAITVHKSQGSEFPAVILPAAQVPPRLCYRNLFYTGVTRGRKLCIVVGRRDVVNRMMSNVRQNLRYSGLAALLAEALPPEQEEDKRGLTGGLPVSHRRG